MGLSHFSLYEYGGRSLCNHVIIKLVKQIQFHLFIGFNENENVYEFPVIF